MYGRLFGWIVNKVNQLLAPPLASRGEEVTEIGKSETGWFEITSLLIWNTFYVCCCLRTSGSSVLSCWLIKIAIWRCHEFKAREITTANRIKWRKSEETKANSKQIQAETVSLIKLRTIPVTILKLVSSFVPDRFIKEWLEFSGPNIELNQFNPVLV